MKKKFSILYFLLCINLLSISILSAFNYFVFHEMNSKSYLESFLDYNKRVVNLAFHNIDRQVMEALVEIPQLYFSDIKRNEPILLPQKQNIAGSQGDIFALVEKLESIQKAYPYVVSIDIYYAGTNTVVTRYNKVHFPINEEETGRYLPWYDEFRQLGVNQHFFTLSANIYPTREPVLTYAKKISGLNWSGDDIVAAFHISPDSFREYIDESNGVFVLADKSGRLLYHSPTEEGQVRQALEVLTKQGGEFDGQEETRTIQAELGGEPVTMFTGTFPLTGLYYAYYLSDTTFLADYNVKNRIFFMNFGISVLFNLLMLAGISYLNYFVYRRRIQTVSKEAGIIIGDENKSFDRSLTALTETITDLSQTVKSSAEVVFQNSLRSLILNRKSEQAYERLFPDCPLGRVCCFILYLDEKDWEELSMRMLQEEFERPGAKGRLLLTTLEKGEMAAIAVYDGAEEQVCQALLEYLSDYTVLSLVSGNPEELSQENLQASYLTASQAARYRFIYPWQWQLSWQALDISRRKSHGSHLKVFAAIEKDINNESIADFKYHLEGLKASFQTGNYAIDYCLSTIRDLVTLLYQIIQRYQLDMWVMYGYDIREYCKQLKDIDEVFEWMNKVCEVLLTNIRQKKRPGDDNLKEKLEQMINDYLEKDITLDYLSDCLSMRPDVLSRTFRQLMGKSYTAYIKEKKLNRALELIEQNHTMKEIAARLGYSSPQYFIKLFKETYGVTPYQYKKRKLQRGEGD